MPTTTDTAAPDAHTRRHPRAQVRHLGVLLTAGALLLATAACSDTDDPGADSGDSGEEGASEGDGTEALDVGELDPGLAPTGYEATPQFLRQAVDSSEAIPYRFEMGMDIYITGAGETVDTELGLLSGEYDGAAFRQVVDVAQALEDATAQSGEEVPEGLTGDDAVVESLGNEQSLFVRAPFAATAGDALDEIGASNPLYDLLGTLDGGWGYVDLARAGETITGQSANRLGTGGYDPRALVDTLLDADEATELGSAEIDGTPVTGLGAEVPLGTMLEAQGMDPNQFVQQMGAAAEIPAEMLGAVTEIPLPMEAWLSQDGHLRQLRMVMGVDFLQALVEATGGDTTAMEEQIDEYEQVFTVDYLDYGDESITVELPATAEATDITDDYVAVLGA